MALPAGADGIHHGWLETCGPTSAVNVLDAMGKDLSNKSSGGASLRPMDFLAIWMNTPENFVALGPIPGVTSPDQYLENELAQAYPQAVPRVFATAAEYFEGKTWEWLTGAVSGGIGAMICLKNPGHFLAVVAFDDVTQELIYNDSWPGRTGTDGWNLRMGKAEWTANVKPYVIVFA
jgi:hypothetical protein